MGTPLRHHFLPEFYLKQWAKEDGRLVEFSKPYGNAVKPRRTHPGGTGFIPRLYALDGMPDNLAHDLESKFLSPVDSRAAEALVALRAGTNFSELQRLAWSSFVATLLSRMPEDIALLKNLIKELVETVLPSLQPTFDKSKSITETRTFRELADEFIDNSGQRAISFARKIMSNDRLVRGIAAMEWSILTFGSSKFELLTSDRPVIYTNVLGHPQSHIVLPVGPRRLFVAAKDRALIRSFREMGQDALVAATNAGVTESADRYVYGSKDTQLRFVQNRMGSAKVPTLVERVHEIQKDKYGPLLMGLRQATDELLISF
jgi:Protein of unknown function (DUF4238)